MLRSLLVSTFLLAGCGDSAPADAPANTPAAGSGTTESPVVRSDEWPPAPDFELPEMSGDTWKLADHRGKVVIVNFWATWCGPCIRETPAFVDLANEWADRPFEIVGVSLDQEGFEVIRPFAERYEVSYPMLLDDGALADEFGGVYAMPASFVIDKEGRVVHRVFGEFPFEDMRDDLEALLGA